MEELERKSARVPKCQGVRSKVPGRQGACTLTSCSLYCFGTIVVSFATPPGATLKYVTGLNTI